MRITQCASQIGVVLILVQVYAQRSVAKVVIINVRPVFFKLARLKEGRFKYELDS